jgi:hypothetical protein
MSGEVMLPASFLGSLHDVMPYLCRQGISELELQAAIGLSIIVTTLACTSTYFQDLDGIEFMRTGTNLRPRLVPAYSASPAGSCTVHLLHILICLGASGLHIQISLF